MTRRTAKELGYEGMFRARPADLPKDLLRVVPTKGGCGVVVHPRLLEMPESLTDEFIDGLAERVSHALRVIRTEGLARKGKLQQ